MHREGRGFLRASVNDFIGVIASLTFLLGLLSLVIGWWQWGQ
jgi:hypothetical protein